MTKTNVKVIECENEDDLYCHFGGQILPQKSFIELDCERETLSARYDPEIGGGLPAGVWHDRILRFDVSCLTGSNANMLLEELEELAAIVIDGYESAWDGNNWVGKYNKDAETAKAEIQERINRFCGDLDRLYHVWNAFDWFADSPPDQITADTTDNELEEIEQEILKEIEGNDDIHHIENLAGYLEYYRDRLRDEE